jgi:hypothetical protein
MTMYVVSLEYKSKKPHGFVPYQSRTLIDMGYTRHMLGISHVYQPSIRVRDWYGTNA